MYLELALIGHPLSHSFSAAYFNNKFAQEHTGTRYINLDFDSIDLLPEILAAHPQLIGFNVTAPYKESVMRYLDEIRGIAKDIGAVNTVRIKRSDTGIRLIGYNTDCDGFRESLLPLIDIPANARALVFGTGGASKAVRHALEMLNIPYLSVSRHPAAGSIGYGDISAQILRQHTLLINATPLGTFPDSDGCVLSDFSAIGPEHRCYDLVYNPPMTRFLAEAMRRGATVRNGLEMLRVQAEASYRIWMSD